MNAAVRLGEWLPHASSITALTGAGRSAAVDHGARPVIINVGPTPYNGIAAAVLRTPIGEVLPRLVDRVVPGPALRK